MHLRSLILATCISAVMPTALAASEVVDEFQKAMGSGDATVKRGAIGALAGSGEKDDVVLPLLIGAVGDRQTHDAAIAALRARTHLAPAAYRGQSHYPSYPSGDGAADWSTWLAERAREKDQEKKVKEAEKLATEAKKKADDAEKKEKDKEQKEKDKKEKGDKGDKGEAADAKTAEGTDVKPTEGDDAAAKVAKARENQPPPQDLGKLDRVVFKNGSNLVCYILTRRTDADGNLISLRIVHPDGSGEETLAAAMISRIEEDVKQ